MRLPNGYGSVTKLSGNRRNPYHVKKTIGFNEKAHPIYQTIGYFPTRKIALQALANFNENPYDINVAKITFTEVYEKWSKKKFAEISASAVRTYKSAYNYCTELYDMTMLDIRPVHMQNVVDNAKVGSNTRARIKSLLNMMYEYCLINEIVKVNYADLVKRPKVVVEHAKIPFSDKEIKLLWDNIDILYVDIALIEIYTGFRPSELCELSFKNNIDLKEYIITGGIKTEAGKDRKVPINDKIKPLIDNIKTKGNSHLVCDLQGDPMTYDKYYDAFKDVMCRLGMSHTPHECRHTFATLLDNAGANKVAIQRLMGHASKSVTDKVYTHKDIEELRKAIALI